MAKVHSHGLMEKNIPENGKTTNNMVKDHILIQVEINILEIGKMELKRAMELLFIQMGINILGNFMVMS